MDDAVEVLYELIGEFLCGIEGLPDLSEILDGPQIGALNMATSQLAFLEEVIESLWEEKEN